MIPLELLKVGAILVYERKSFGATQSYACFLITDTYLARNTRTDRTSDWRNAIEIYFLDSWHIGQDGNPIISGNNNKKEICYYPSVWFSESRILNS